jgi:hypothetical protein
MFLFINIIVEIYHLFLKLIEMGIDSELFCEEVNEDLRCSICLEVFDQPLQISTCKHIFCANCIYQWINKCSEKPTCPHDRRRISRHYLKSAPKYVKKQIDHLLVKCQFNSIGCHARVKYNQLKQHQQNCEFNPKFSNKLSKWLRRSSFYGSKVENKRNYLYITTMPSLYSYSYCNIANRY